MTGGFVSKIPSTFVDRTVARLLPSADAISRMSRAALLELAAKRDELRALVSAEPARFFVPNRGGQEGFLTCDDRTKRVHALFAGNKHGKSTAGAIKFVERLVGRPVWGAESRVFAADTPARGAVFAEDFDSHKETTIPTILSWFPRGFVKKTLRNPQGHVVEIDLANGSIIHFRTYDQGSDKAEGKDWHVVWCDEPPPRDIYTAIYRGLVAMDGRLLITATLLKEPWLWDEADKASFQVFEGDIDDNTWLNQEAKRDFLGSLSDEELAVRKTGRPATLTGRIYKMLRDCPPFVLPAADLPDPANCPTLLGIDPHERRPTYALWAYVTEDNEIVWFDYDFLVGSTDDIKHQLKAREHFHVTKPRICVMDPNRGKARQLGGVSWAETYEDFGYDVQMGDDNLHRGHTAVVDYLRGPDGRPRMFFSDALHGHGGPIYQMLRYGWQDWAGRRAKFERAVKETPNDRYKDFPDIIRYVCMMSPNYHDLWEGPEVLDRWPTRNNGRAIRAYT